MRIHTDSTALLLSVKIRIRNTACLRIALPVRLQIEYWRKEFLSHDTCILTGFSYSGCCADSFAARGGAAQADHRDEEGHAGPAGGSSPRLPQYRHQGIRATAPLPGLPQGSQ